MRNDKYFYCYSYPLKSFIMDSGEKYVIKGIHKNSQKTFWVFERNENVERLLAEWTARRPDVKKGDN